MEAYVLLAILAITAATLITRSGPQFIDTRLSLPARIEAALRYAPACALAAIAAPDFVFSGDTLQVTLTNPKLLAGIAATLIFATIRSMIATIIGGMMVFWLSRVLLGI